MKEEKALEEESISGLVDLLVELREQFREKKDFEASDTIRARLRELGVVLEDTPKGVRWKRQILD